jgi:protein gp37
MGNSTKISWTDATWNPIRGCSRVSEGCRNCYAERIAARFSKPGQAYHGFAQVVAPRDLLDRAGGRRDGWTRKVAIVGEHIADPLRWRKPRRIFVNSMSDLFHESLTNEQIAAVFGVMAAASQHTFQVLTKRARRMREWFEWVDGSAAIDGVSPSRFCFALAQARGVGERPRRVVDSARDASWPLPNVWLGVSVENQAAADERIPELLRTPAELRFLSCEPLLGSLTIHREHLAPFHETDAMLARTPRIDWAIAGCESGAGARPCDVEWLRSLRDQCAAAEVPFFLKQAKLGCGCPPLHSHNDTEGCETCTCTWSAGDTRVGSIESGVTFGPGSKRKPGGIIELPYLDGVQHRELAWLLEARK